MPSVLAATSNHSSVQVQAELWTESGGWRGFQKGSLKRHKDGVRVATSVTPKKIPCKIVIEGIQ